MTVTAERTLHVGEILDVLTNDIIFDSISEDGATFNDLRINVIDDYWVDLRVDGVLIGVTQFKPIFNKCYDAHIHILPKHRKLHSLNAGKALIEWCGENIGGCILYTTIPAFCKNVVNFLKVFDFNITGEIPLAWKKNGKQNDMIILTRSV